MSDRTLRWTLGGAGLGAGAFGAWVAARAVTLPGVLVGIGIAWFGVGLVVGLVLGGLLRGPR